MNSYKSIYAEEIVVVNDRSGPIAAGGQFGYELYRRQIIDSENLKRAISIGEEGIIAVDGDVGCPCCFIFIDENRVRWIADIDNGQTVRAVGSEKIVPNYRESIAALVAGLNISYGRRYPLVEREDMVSAVVIRGD